MSLDKELEEKETDFDKLLETRKLCRELIAQIKRNTDSKKTRDKMKFMRSQFNFVKVFGSESVQGTAGIISLKGIKDVPIVFKISNSIDYAIEHESHILEDLKEIEDFCPHFMSKFGMIELPVACIFFYDPEENVGFMEDSSNYMITPVLFTEYVSRYTFYHFLSTNNITVSNSLMLQLISGLVMAQDHIKFTHYDMHLDNTLVRCCDKNTVHIYKFGDKRNDVLFVPTHGYVPVVIDMGSSYSKNVGNLTTSIEHYEHGLQSCMYDKMNDFHHLMLSASSSLAEDMTHYEKFYYDLMCYFCPVPMCREKGWKILKYDLVEEIMDYLFDNCEFSKTREKRHLYRDYFEDIIDMLNGCVSLPLKKMTIEEINKRLPVIWDQLFEEIIKIIECEVLSDDMEAFYIFKEIVFASMKKKNGQNVKMLVENVKNRIGSILSGGETKKINFSLCIELLCEMGDYLGAFYNIFVEKNIQVIERGYNIMSEDFGIKNMRSLLNYMRRTIPSNLDFKKGEEYTIYIFDSFEKSHKKKNIKFEEEEVEKINAMTNIQKCYYFLEV